MCPTQRYKKKGKESADKTFSAAAASKLLKRNAKLFKAKQRPANVVGGLRLHNMQLKLTSKEEEARHS